MPAPERKLRVARDPSPKPMSTEAGSTHDKRVSTLPAKSGARRPVPPPEGRRPVEEPSGVRRRVGEGIPGPQPVPVDLLRYLSYAPSAEKAPQPSEPPSPPPDASARPLDRRAVPVVRVVRAILRKLDLAPNELFLLESCNGVSTVGDLIDIGIVPAARVDTVLRKLAAANIVYLRAPSLRGR